MVNKLYLTLQPFIFACCVGFALCGCATPYAGTTAGKSNSAAEFIELKDKYQKLALSAEKQEDFYQASFYWWILASLDRNELQARDRAKYLLDRSYQKADDAFERAKKYLAREQSQQANKALLQTLIYNPQHPEALRLLKSSDNTDFKQYRVNSGDSLQSIAMQEYRNADMAAVIANYNDLPLRQKLKPGSQIKLITGEGSYPVDEKAKKVDIVSAYEETISAFTLDILKQADEQYQKENHSRAMSLAEIVLKDYPVHPKASELYNKAGYQQAKNKIEQGDLLEAIDLLKAIDGNFADVRRLRLSLQTKITELAEAHYRKGVKSFLSEDFEKAKAEWETALRLNPEHSKASKGLAKVSKLLGKIREIE